MAKKKTKAGSTLLLDEFFRSKDTRFLEQLLQIRSFKATAALAERWKSYGDSDWHREQLLSYLDRPLDRFGHQPLVKRLFKFFEQRRDDEMMGAYLVAFDRMVRRKRITRHRWDWETREYWQEECLVTPRDTLPREEFRIYRDWSGRELKLPISMPKDGRLFSYHTRYYLRRRVWRYFRRMGYQQPEAYPRAVAHALRRYLDGDVAEPINMLDAWCLLQICFRGSDALEFTPSHVRIVSGHSLANLSPAPRFPELWRTDDGFAVLLDLLATARCRLVRMWASQLLLSDHKARLEDLTPEQLLELLSSEHPEAQEFAAEALRSAKSVGRWNVTTWLSLLKTPNPTALMLICELMAEHVSTDRLTIEQCIALAGSRPTPVAEMGFTYLREKPVDAMTHRSALLTLAEAPCVAVSGRIAEWLLGLFGGDRYDRDAVTHLFDSLQRPVRDAAWAWLMPHTGEDGKSPGYDDPQLWACLLETPFDDLKLALIDILERRSKLPVTGGTDAIEPIWTAVVLGVHRGGRQKVKAVRQAAAALNDSRGSPEAAKKLVGLLGIAVRSIRGPEQRAGLAAIVGAVKRQPDLAPILRDALPELRILPSPEPAEKYQRRRPA